MGAIDAQVERIVRLTDDIDMDQLERRLVEVAVAVRTVSEIIEQRASQVSAEDGLRLATSLLALTGALRILRAVVSLRRSVDQLKGLV